jgi:very-short-patch-repair endonuclease
VKYLWKAFDLPEPVAEFRFAPPRKWRFDFCWPDRKIAMEIEGAVWTRGRHTRGSGFIKDLEKYNFAAKRGWYVFRFTTQDFNNGVAHAFMKDIF